MSYVDETEFKALIEDLKTAKDDRQVILDRILTDFIKPICEGVIEKYYHYHDSDTREDMIQEALILASKKIERFTPGKGSAFNFATKICRNRMIDALDKEMNWAKRKAVSLEYAYEGTMPERYVSMN